MTVPGFSKKTLIIGLVFIILIFTLIPSLYFYNKYQKLKKSAPPSESSVEELKSLIEKVASHIELPQGEEPTVAIVSDKEIIKNQPFFSRAENGDKVLIYTKAKKAILYRPSTNKIIEVGPVNIGESTPSAALNNVSPATSAAVKVAIYNASRTAGLAASTQIKLEDKFGDITVVSKANSKGEYEKNLVFDLTGQYKHLAAEMAKFLNGEVEAIPSTEVRPDADILVIVRE